MTLALDAVIALFLLVWLLASAFAQGSQTALLRYDYLGLLPDFRFFAPRPVSRDICIYARATGANGYSTAWRPLFSAKKKWWCFAWNPQHRTRKAVFDLFLQLDSFREAPEAWHLSLPYLALLNAATTAFSDNTQATGVQFMIACYAGYEEATHDVLFLSNNHRIGPPT